MQSLAIGKSRGLSDLRRANPIVKLISLSLFLSIFDNLLYASFIPLFKTPSAIVAGIAFVVFGITFLKSGKYKLGTPVYVFLFLITISIIEYLHGLFTPELMVFSRFMQWVQPLLLFIMAALLFKDPRSLRLVWGVFYLTVVFMSLVVTLKIGMFTSVALDRNAIRVGFSGLNLNQEAYLYALGIITSLWYLINTSSRDTVRLAFIGATSLLLAYSLFNTGSRGGLLGLMVGALLVLWGGRKTGNKNVYYLAIPVIMVAVIVLFLGNDMIQGRINRTFEEQHFSGRDKYFWISFDLFLESPLIGYGSSIYDRMGISLERYIPRATHNGVVQVILTYGLVGFAIWLPIIFSVFRSLLPFWQTREGSLLFSLFLVSIVNHAFSDMAFNRFFWMIMALSFNVRHYLSNSSPLISVRQNT